MAGSNPLGSLFGRSPIRPIQEHMQVANSAAQCVPGLLEACSAGDWEQARALQKDILDAEKSADKLKRSVRKNLPNSLFMPVPRSDLLELVSMQDSVANIARDISMIVISRQMQFPEKLVPKVQEYAQACAAASQQALSAIQELDELLEVGFTGREVQRVESMLKELGKLERRTDRLGASLRGGLFKMEQELPPVDVMFYYRVLDLLGTLADVAEKVGDRLQILMAR